jgi:hypothetical protein
LLVKLIHSGIIADAKYFREMTAEEKTEATSKTWLFGASDIFVDLNGTGQYTYHDSKDIEILTVTQ